MGAQAYQYSFSNGEASLAFLVRLFLDSLASSFSNLNLVSLEIGTRSPPQTNSTPSSGRSINPVPRHNIQSVNVPPEFSKDHAPFVLYSFFRPLQRIQRLFPSFTSEPFLKSIKFPYFVYMY